MKKSVIDRDNLIDSKNTKFVLKCKKFKGRASNFVQSFEKEIDVLN